MYPCVEKVYHSQVDCAAKFPSNSIFKFADDTTAVGRISNNDETEYRNEIENLVNWCGDNNLSLNVNKTKGDCHRLQEA